MAESDTTTSIWNPAELFAGMLKAQGEAAGQARAWAQSAGELQAKWLDFQQQQQLPERLPPLMTDPAQWLGYLEAFYKHVPLADPGKQAELWRQTLDLWSKVLAEYNLGPQTGEDAAPAHVDQPFRARRIADPKRREPPEIAQIPQT